MSNESTIENPIKHYQWLIYNSGVIRLYSQFEEEGETYGRGWVDSSRQAYYLNEEVEDGVFPKVLFVDELRRVLQNEEAKSLECIQTLERKLVEGSQFPSQLLLLKRKIKEMIDHCTQFRQGEWGTEFIKSLQSLTDRLEIYYPNYPITDSSQSEHTERSADGYLGYRFPVNSIPNLHYVLSELGLFDENDVSVKAFTEFLRATDPDPANHAIKLKKPYGKSCFILSSLEELFERDWSLKKMIDTHCIIKETGKPFLSSNVYTNKNDFSKDPHFEDFREELQTALKGFISSHTRKA